MTEHRASVTESSNYLFHSDSAAARGAATEAQNQAMGAQ